MHLGKVQVLHNLCSSGNALGAKIVDEKRVEERLVVNRWTEMFRCSLRWTTIHFRLTYLK